MKRTISVALSVFKYILAVFMMYAGIATMLLEPATDSDLGFIYENRLALASFGLFFFASGLTLFLGKVFKKVEWCGRGLFGTYLGFLFGFILNWIGYDFSSAWGNGVAAVVVGGLYLRWKYHIYYYEPPLDKVRKTMLESEPLDNDR